jgi:tetratricopeptide (TPR) repeat protein
VEQSLALYQTLDDEWWTARALVVKAEAVLDTDVTTAKQLLEESLALGQALGDRAGEITFAFQPLVVISMRQGLFQEAENAARELLAVKQAIDERFGIMNAFSLLGETLFWRGEYAEAESNWDECLAMSKELGHVRAQLSASDFLGRAKARQGQYGEVRAYGELVLTLVREREAAWATPWALELLGVAALAVNENAEARQWLEEALSLAAEGISYVFNLRQRPVLHQLLGITALRLNQPLQTRQHFFEAQREAIETRDITQLVGALPGIALFLADQGAAKRAVELYALASRYPHVANSQWYEDVVGKHIAAAAATLPPEVVAAAQERGRARDLWETAEELLAELESKADNA